MAGAWLSWSWGDGNTRTNPAREELISHALATPEGRTELANAMVEPLRNSMRMPGMVRDVLKGQGFLDGEIKTADGLGMDEMGREISKLKNGDKFFFHFSGTKESGS